MVQAEKVTKRYTLEAGEILPLQGVSLTLPEGEFLSLMGPSGSGKSTLLNLIAGIDEPSEGRIIVNGVDLAGLDDSGLSRWRTRTIGYVFQRYNLIPVLTAWENVELPLLLLNLTRDERRKHTETALKAAGVHDRRDHYPRQLSGGQEQRVAIARAIVTDPKVLLADEPTGNLDADSEDEVLILLKRLNREFGKSLILVTHDPHAASYADRVLHLEKGILSETGGESGTGTGTFTGNPEANE